MVGFEEYPDPPLTTDKDTTPPSRIVVSIIPPTPPPPETDTEGAVLYPVPARVTFAPMIEPPESTLTVPVACCLVVRPRLRVVMLLTLFQYRQFVKSCVKLVRALLVGLCSKNIKILFSSWKNGCSLSTYLISYISSVRG